MDPAAVKHLIVKYVNCIKLLLSDTVPHELPDVLDDLMQHTMVFSDRVKNNQERHISNDGIENVVVQEPIVDRNLLRMVNGVHLNESTRENSTHFIDTDEVPQKSIRQPTVMAKPLRIDKKMQSKESKVDIEKTIYLPRRTHRLSGSGNNYCSKAEIDGIVADKTMDNENDAKVANASPKAIKRQRGRPKTNQWKIDEVNTERNKRQEHSESPSSLRNEEYYSNAEIELKKAKWQPIVKIKRLKIDEKNELDDGIAVEKTKIQPKVVLKRLKMDYENDSKVASASPKTPKRQRGRPKKNQLKNVEVKTKRNERQELSKSSSTRRNEDILID